MTFLVKRRTGDSWSYSFSISNLIEGTFSLLRNIEYEGGVIQKRVLTTRVKDLTSDITEPPRRFLQDLKLIEEVPHNYNVTEQGKKIVEMLERGRDPGFSKYVFNLIKDRYQVARYLEKFIAPPGRRSFRKEEFEKFVIDEWLLDFGYEKDDHIDRENALATAQWLGIIKLDAERKEYVVNREFKSEFFDIEFLAIIRELANFRNEWTTIDLCEKLRVRHGEYMKHPPDITFILERLIELQKENIGAIEFSPGWPTPPIPPAYAFLRFDPRHIATLRAPRSWREIRSSDREQEQGEEK